jgi:hypothetical protein
MNGSRTVVIRRVHPSNTEKKWIKSCQTKLMSLISFFVVYLTGNYASYYQ